MSVNEVRPHKATTPLAIKGDLPDAQTFCIGDEDHTLGNSLRHVLIRDRSVEFAGYSVPHPAEPVVHLRIQTVKSTTAKAVLMQACQALSAQCSIVIDKLESMIPLVQEDRLKIEKVLEEELREDEDDEDAPDVDEEPMEED
jgi:DNA-directed RNA polymerases I and III subunit RPAC2